ncbi:MAG TPA: cytochrome c biogenesis protein ResB [Verrucomicrobiae bacterium]|jgi:hypothetical protein|nr:cytochrome c biogenesis protein ResB [Verrucomicrobiae bacterium]
MITRFVHFFGSLRLTLVCLGLALVLVFAGTLAQVHLGLYVVQSEFFRSFFIYWKPAGTHWQIPIFPGGWLIGTALLMNLLAAHIVRFHFSRRKLGLLIVHAGLLLLLGGFFISEILQVESQMRLEIGETKSYAEDSRRNELVVIDVTDPDRDNVVAVPESRLEQGGEIRPEGLPFSLRVKRYLPNSQPAGPMSGAGEKIKAANGVGQRMLFSPAPVVSRMDDENKPAAWIEIAAGQEVIGNWTVSTWLTKRPWCIALTEQFGALGIAVNAPQSFTWRGRNYVIALRPTRYYKPYTITLLEFKHDVYAGTDVPSNFSSKVHLRDPARGEDRDVVIRMNSPLRYGGETYYQASFEPGDRVSILQVVHNPAAMVPYVSCSLIIVGLMAQFFTHLLAFVRRRARPPAPASARLRPLVHAELMNDA